MSFLNCWRFATLVLVALFMGLEFAHTLEMPAKLQYDGALYVTVQNSLYQYFGAPGPGAWVTVGAVLAAIALTILTRKRHASFKWTLIGTLCLLVAFPLIFFVWIEPVNVVIEQTNPEAVPANWEQLRHQWELAHVINFGLVLAGFTALLVAILTPLNSVKHQPYD
ncbi:MAG: DUF1772 domain-containing protein [Elainellaceae cyanobacterium]